MRAIDLTGRSFGLLTVLSLAPTGDRKRHWICLCGCSRETVVSGANLRSGNTRSCGCVRSQKSGERRRSHGRTRTPEYRAWSQLIQRCTNPKNPRYSTYGARGISVCKRWLQFAHFLEDMGARPAADLSIDRVDNDRGYEPGNCRWATRSQQAQNTTRTKRAA